MLFKSYFSARFVLSKKALISLCLSDRSDGKTFSKNQKCLDNSQGNPIFYYTYYNISIEK